MIGLAKGDNRFDGAGFQPWLHEPVKAFLAGDPRYVEGFLSLWESAPIVAPGTRHDCPLIWLHVDGAKLRFLFTPTLAGPVTELQWHDWVPIDRATWSGSIPPKRGHSARCQRCHFAAQMFVTRR